MIRTMIRNLTFLAASGLAFAASDARADFMGSLGLGGFGTTINTSGLGAASTFTIPTLLVSTPGFGDFSSVPQFTSFTGGTFSLGSRNRLQLLERDIWEIHRDRRPDPGEHDVDQQTSGGGVLLHPGELHRRARWVIRQLRRASR